ncbi:unnamed protein product [Lepidochelys olivacea]
MGRRGEEVELERSVRRLREKFFGRVTVEEAALLMRRYRNELATVCGVTALRREQLGDADPEDRRTLEHDPVLKKVVEKLKQEEEQQKQKPSLDCENDKDIEAIAQQLRVLPLTERNLRMFEHTSRNLIPSAERQFACQPCDSAWWRRVPERKQVRPPVGAGGRWGRAGPWPRTLALSGAPHRCPGAGCAGSAMTRCPTTGCGALPSSSAPPATAASGAQHRWAWPLPASSAAPACCPAASSCRARSRSRNPHSCYAEDCYNRREPHVPGTHCVHPRSRSKNRLPKVLFASLEHQSTGSTVATCLSQGSLAHCDLDELLLDDLAEESEGSGD